MNEIDKLKGVIYDLKTCLKIKEAQIAKLEKRCQETTKSTMSKEDIEKFIKGHMPMLTDNQIKLMTKHNKRVNWTADEISKGFTSAFFSHGGHKYHIKHLGIPLPGIRTLNDWAMKISIAPGILSDVLLMLKSYVETLTEAERQVVVSFDEMACKSLVKYHKGLDAVFGPNNEMQAVMVRGLISKFKQLIYVAFDMAMTKKILFELISELTYIGINVVGIVSDCGGGNVGLWGELGVCCMRDHIHNWFKHPVTGKKSNAAKNKLIQKRPSSVPTKEDISLRSMEKYDKKRTASVPLHSLETYDNFEKFASDIERRKRRKLKKFST